VLPEVLEHSLHQQRMEILTAADIFSSLTQRDIARIADVSEKRILPRGELICAEGDPGDTFCMVVSGAVSVFRTSTDGVKSTLANLEAGSGFGEMALLTGEPRSASVETVEPTSLVVIHRKDFDDLLKQHPELTQSFVKVLSEHLTRGNIQQAEASATEKAYQHLVSEQSSQHIPELIGECRKMARLRQMIAEAANSAARVIFLGEPGTEKLGAAKRLHELGGDESRPFLVMDAHSVTVTGADGGESDALHLELAQESTLFGHEKGAFSFAQIRRLGLLEVGDGGTVVIENLDQLAVEMQEKLADFLESGRFSRLGGRQFLQSRVLVLATASVDPARLAENDAFSSRLLNFFGSTLEVPPLRERKRDLRELVDHLMRHYSESLDRPVTAIDRESYNQLAAYDWPGNREELELVIRHGISLTFGDTLLPRVLFLGHAPVIGEITFNLLRLDKVKAIIRSRLFPRPCAAAHRGAVPGGSGLGILGSAGPLGEHRPDSDLGPLVASAGTQLAAPGQVVVRLLPHGRGQRRALQALQPEPGSAAFYTQVRTAPERAGHRPDHLA